MKKITMKIFTLTCAIAFSQMLVLAQPKVQLTSVGSASTTAVRTLSADTIYTLIGFVNIFPGSALVIPAGTRLISGTGDRGAIQTLRSDTVSGVPRPSGVLIANGTADRPIVLTSRAAFDSSNGSFAQSGGIILNGTARNNVPGGTRNGEGGAGPGGGTNDADSSGSLRYVRVEYGGFVLAPGNEINGFTFNSVGSRTRLEYLQAHRIADDAFEWFGGTCNAKWLVATGCDDDQIDTEFGYRGKIQFVAVVEDAAVANRGYESNNDGSGTSVTPHNKYQAYNITMIGAGIRQANNELNDGMYLRANTGGLHYNHIIANFGGGGVVIDGNAARDNLYANPASDSGLVVANSLFFVKQRTSDADPAGNGNPIWAIRRGSGIGANDSTGLFPLYAASSGNTVGNPNFVRLNFDSPLDGNSPDLRPQAGSPALTGGATPPNDGFFDVTATYRGAFSATNDWTRVWVNWRRLTTPLEVKKNNEKAVTAFSLSQNYPNPFNPSTTINFTLTNAQSVTLRVFDVLGREVATLINGERRAAGPHTINFNASNLSSGTYFYRLESENFSESRKMMLVK
jgi:hypothetical protein